MTVGQRTKRLARGLGSFLLAALAALAAYVAFELPFVRRLATYPFDAPVTAVDWYQPQELVRGATPPRPLPVATPEELGLDPAPLEEAARWTEAVGSVALLVLVDGHVVLERYFGGHGPGDRTNSFSMAKTVLGLLVGIAIEEGFVGSVHDPVSRYLPEWRGDGRSRITFEDLLRMQSGLRNDGAQWNPLSDMVQVHLRPDMMPVLRAIPAVEPPGRRFDYNNMGSQLLGLALERATGQRYARYLSTRLWAPAGAGDAALWLDHVWGRAKTYCCLFATARDWARLGELMRLGGRLGDRAVVPEAWLDAMREPSPLEPRYGYHLWLEAGSAAEEGGEPCPEHFYLDGKLHQRVYVIPSARAVVVRLGEAPRSWDEALLPRLVARAVSGASREVTGAASAPRTARSRP